MTAILERVLPYITLMKPRIATLVGITAFVGAISGGISIGVLELQKILIATILIVMSAAGAAMMNNYLDRDIDRLMKRTMGRPLVSGKASSSTALLLSLFLIVVSVFFLFLMNPLSGALSMIAVLSYSLIYTIYLKRKTPWASIIGSLPGALPPVIGYTAITGRIGVDAILLFIILFIWQPPHFWHLAVMLKRDYERAGIPVLPVVYGEALTRNLTFLFSILMSISIAIPGVMGFTGDLYRTGSLITGVLWLLISFLSFKGKMSSKTAFILSNMAVLVSFVLFAFDRLSYL